MTKQECEHASQTGAQNFMRNHLALRELSPEIAELFKMAWQHGFVCGALFEVNQVDHELDDLINK